MRFPFFAAFTLLVFVFGVANLVFRCAPPKPAALTTVWVNEQLKKDWAKKEPVHQASISGIPSWNLAVGDKTYEMGLRSDGVVVWREKTAP